MLDWTVVRDWSVVGVSLLALFVSWRSFVAAKRANAHAGKAVLRCDFKSSDAMAGITKFRVHNPGTVLAEDVVIEIVEPKDYAAARGRGHVHIVPLFDRLAGGEEDITEIPFFGEDFKALRVGWIDTSQGRQWSTSTPPPRRPRIHTLED